jgi:chemotaxis protein MotB
MATKPKCPEFENHERWLVSYADMVTLLFAVFVVLYAIQIAGQKNQVEKVAASMQESFNAPMGDIPADRRGGPGELGVGVFDYFRGEMLVKPVIKKYRRSEFANPIIDKDLETVQKLIDQTLGKPDKQIVKSTAGDVISVSRVEKGFKIVLLSTLLFEPGQYKINQKSYQNIKRIGDLIKTIDARFLVEGHSDNLPSSNEYSNWELSALRATNIAKILMDDVGIDPDRIGIAGYADRQPRAANNTSEGRALNRRVEIQVKYD